MERKSGHGTSRLVDRSEFQYEMRECETKMVQCDGDGDSEIDSSAAACISTDERRVKGCCVVFRS